MRKTIFLTLLATLTILVGCSKPKGELVGIYSKTSPERTPYGMVHIPRGSFKMGPQDQSATWAIQPSQIDVSIDAFWMDITEITNGEYRQFVNWVRDSIVRRELARMETELGVEAEEARYFRVQYDPYNEAAEPDTVLNWKVKIPWNARWTYEGEEEDNATYLAVNKVFFQSADKLGGGKQLNSHVMNYDYEWIAWEQARKAGNFFDYKTAAYNEGAYVTIDSAYWENGKIVDTVIVKPLTHRGDLISRKILNIYPDTMCWLTEYTYSYNEPAMLNYFAHPSYSYFPVVGITWEQAVAFCHWRTSLYSSLSKMPRAQEYRLPTEAEWEYAARGGRYNAQYPWGGPYVRDSKGCFMANFKPMRGNYTEDGYLIPSHVGSFDPNDYGLYDMAGNVAEWTRTTYSTTSAEFVHDMNPDYTYHATSKDPKIMHRKVIKGGSWKDVGAYLQCGMKDAEYQERCRPSIGFRCVRVHVAD